MPDIGYWLDRKYSILQQQADTAGRVANADVGYTTARTNEVAPDARANRGLTTAQTFQTNEAAKTVAPLARSLIGMQGATSRNLDANAGLTGQEAARLGMLNRYVTPRVIGDHVGSLLRGMGTTPSIGQTVRLSPDEPTRTRSRLSILDNAGMP